MDKPDIRTDILTEEEFTYNCMHYSEWAFFTPPDKFLFYHYDTDKLLICFRYNDKFSVVDMMGNFYGQYKIKTVSMYLKTCTWILVESEKFWDTIDFSKRKDIISDLTKDLKATSPWFVGLK